MATAEFELFSDNSGTPTNPTATNIDGVAPVNFRFSRADNALVNTNDPNIIPTSGFSFSRWKSLYYKCSIAPSLQVSNFKIYGDGVQYPAGVFVDIGDETPTKNSSGSAGYDPSDTDDEDITNHINITAFSDFFSFTVGSPKLLSISETGNLINAVNETTDYFVMQMKVDQTATAADLTNKAITAEWDEI